MCVVGAPGVHGTDAQIREILTASGTTCDAMSLLGLRLWFVCATARAATVEFLDSRFTFSSNGSGFHVSFDCPSDKWCGMIVSEGREPEVFTGGDTYVLARHSLCDCDCCEGLRGGAFPDHSCPHPLCCDGAGRPVGLRRYPDVMGGPSPAAPGEPPTPWDFKTHKGVGGPHGLRGDAPCQADMEPTFLPVDDIDGRHLVELHLPFGAAPDGFYSLTGALRAVTFSQASRGAMSFNGGVDTLDVGYHGKGSPFVSCLMSADALCGCSWPLDEAWALSVCVPLNSSQTQSAQTADGGDLMEARRAPILAHGVLACVAWGVLMPAAAVLPRFWKAALPKWWFPLHRGLMLSGVTVALTSFVVIVSTTHSAHFDGTHKLGGLILTIVLCLQPLNAFARPHKPAAGEEKGRTLRFAWRVAHAILGLYMLSHALYQMHSASNGAARPSCTQSSAADGPSR